MFMVAEVKTDCRYTCPRWQCADKMAWTKRHVSQARSWVVHTTPTQATRPECGRAANECLLCHKKGTDVHRLFSCQGWWKGCSEMKNELRVHDTIAINKNKKTWLWERGVSIFPWRPKRKQGNWRSQKYWVSEVSKQRRLVPDIYRASVAVDGPLRCVAGRYAACGWAEVQPGVVKKEMWVLYMALCHLEGAEVAIHSDNPGAATSAAKKKRKSLHVRGSQWCRLVGLSKQQLRNIEDNEI